MQVNFYTFSKRKNSTKQPATGGTSMEVFLKDNTSVLKPELEIAVSASPSNWNYVYIPDFSRYYYIVSWVAERGIWRAACTVDYLASWKPYILDTMCLLIYSDSDASSKFLVDDRLVRRTTFETASVEADMEGVLNPFDATEGIFALQTFNDGGLKALGATQIYYFSWTGIRVVMDELTDSNFWNKLKSYFNNPFDSIIDCFYLPLEGLSYFKNGTINLDVVFGDQTVDSGGLVPQGSAFDVASKYITMDIPWRYDDFRRCEPWTKMELLVPFCGVVELDAAALSPYEKIQIDYTVDPLSGSVDAIISPYSADGSVKTIVGEAHGNCRIQVPLALTQPRTGEYIGGAITSLGGVAAGVVSGNPSLAGMGIIHGIGSVFSPAKHKKIGGSGGTIVDAILGDGKFQKFKLMLTSYDGTLLPSNFQTLRGAPTFLDTKLNGFLGYVQTDGFSIEAPAYDDEIVNINSQLDAGIYIE